jgi:hypothetical protein
MRECGSANVVIADVQNSFTSFTFPHSITALPHSHIFALAFNMPVPRHISLSAVDFNIFYEHSVPKCGQPGVCRLWDLFCYFSFTWRGGKAQKLYT